MATGTLEEVTQTPEATFTLGVALGRALGPRDFVGLEGPLGAGKTLFARGVAHGAGVPLDEVTSPSYSIVQSYRGRVLLHHADLFRLTSEDDLYGTGYFDLLESDGAWLVEWVGQVPGAAPEDGLHVRLTPLSPTTRHLAATASGQRGAALLERWIAAAKAGGPLPVL